MDIAILNQFNPWWLKKSVPSALLGKYRRPGFELAKKYLSQRLMLLLYGLRRVGKTTILYQLIQQLLQNGVNPLHILYFSFDEQTAEINQLVKTYEEKVLKGKVAEQPKRCFFFFDEIQKSVGWENKVKLLYDLNPNLKIFLSGSSSLALRQKSSESLAGRIIDILVKPLDFAEFLAWKNVQLDIERPEISQSAAQPLLMDFLRKGGLPEIIQEEDDDFIKAYLKNTVLERILYRDIPQEFSLKDIGLLKTLLELFAREPGAIVNIERLSRDLKRSKITLTNYLEYLKSSLLVREVKNLRPGFLTASRKAKKIYPAIPAISFVYQVDFYSEANLQRTAETIVAEHLSAQYYYRNTFEIDFVQKTNKGVLPIEVKYGKPDPSQLQKFLAKFNPPKAILVSKEMFQPRKDKIETLPLWLFLLHQDFN